MVSGAKQHLAAFRCPGVHQFNWPNEVLPKLSELLRKFFLSCQGIGDRKIVFAKDSPNPASREQVAGVVDGSQHLTQGSHKYSLFFSGASSDPAENRPVFVSIAIDAEFSLLLID